MPHPIVGFLAEQGFSASDIGEMLTPMELYDGGDSGIAPHGAPDFGSTGVASDRIASDTDEALRAILTLVRDERSLPGPQAVVKPGTPPPQVPTAKAVRVDTNKSFHHMRKQQKDASAAPKDDVDALTARGQDELMNGPAYERDITESEELSGMYVRPYESAELSGMYIRPSERAELLGADQSCMMCGKSDGYGSAICNGCRIASIHGLGLPERGQVNRELLGFEGRGAASDIYGGLYHPNLPERGQVNQELLGYTARQMELLGDVTALDPASQIYDQPEEQINLSFSDPEASQHIATWQHGPNLYSSIRLTGWDREPRIITGTLPYSKAMGVVIGYAARCGVPPATLIGLAHPLAQMIGAASIIPRLAAASPKVLGYVHSKRGPLIIGIRSNAPLRRS